MASRKPDLRKRKIEIAKKKNHEDVRLESLLREIRPCRSSRGITFLNGYSESLPAERTRMNHYLLNTAVYLKVEDSKGRNHLPN